MMQVNMRNNEEGVLAIQTWDSLSPCSEGIMSGFSRRGRPIMIAGTIAGIGALAYKYVTKENVLFVKNKCSSFLGWVFGQQSVHAIVEKHIQGESFYLKGCAHQDDTVVVCEEIAYVEQSGDVRHRGCCVFCHHIHCKCHEVNPEGMWCPNFDDPRAGPRLVSLRQMSEWLTFKRVFDIPNVVLMSKLRQHISLVDVIKPGERSLVDCWDKMKTNFGIDKRRRADAQSMANATDGTCVESYSLLRRILTGDNEQIQPYWFPTCGKRYRQEELVEMLKVLDKNKKVFFELKRETAALTIRGHDMTEADRQSLLQRVIRHMKDVTLNEDEFDNERDKMRLTYILYEALATPTINQCLLARPPGAGVSI
jgi:hypothetical protein